MRQRQGARGFDQRFGIHGAPIVVVVAAAVVIESRLPTGTPTGQQGVLPSHLMIQIFCWCPRFGSVIIIIMVMVVVEFGIDGRAKKGPGVGRPSDGRSETCAARRTRDAGDAPRWTTSFLCSDGRSTARRGHGVASFCWVGVSFWAFFLLHFLAISM
jgi:hypothetical protein